MAFNTHSFSSFQNAINSYATIPCSVYHVLGEISYVDFPIIIWIDLGVSLVRVEWSSTQILMGTSFPGISSLHKSVIYPLMHINWAISTFQCLQLCAWSLFSTQCNSQFQRWTTMNSKPFNAPSTTSSSSLFDLDLAYRCFLLRLSITNANWCSTIQWIIPTTSLTMS